MGLNEMFGGHGASQRVTPSESISLQNLEKLVILEICKSSNI